MEEKEYNKYFYFNSNDIKCSIAAIIYKRLVDWGNGYSLLDGSMVALLQDAFCLFQDDKTLRNDPSVRNQGYNLEIGLTEEFLGWECAFGQIIDLSNPQICKILPYIFTAYLYNFCEVFRQRSKPDDQAGRRTRYVKLYLYHLSNKKLYKSVSKQKKEDESDQLEAHNEYRNILRYCNLDFFSSKKVPDKKPKGIGKLLSGDFDCTSEDDNLKWLSECFIFPPTEKLTVDSVTFIVPSDCTSAFDKSIGHIHSSALGDGVNIDENFYTGKRMYDEHCFWNLFISWYYTLSKFADIAPQRYQQIKNINLRPDPIENYLLLLRAFKNTEELNRVQQELKIRGKDTVATEIEQDILCAYEVEAEYRESLTVDLPDGVDENDGDSYILGLRPLD